MKEGQDTLIYYVLAKSTIIIMSHRPILIGGYFIYIYIYDYHYLIQLFIQQIRLIDTS